MPALPTGTVTFLFTDIEGSTRLLQQLGPRYAEALGAHQVLVRAALAAHHGREVDTQGDSFFAAFPRASDALAAADQAQHDLAAHAWPEGVALRVRMGLHTGAPLVAAGRYVGLDVHRAARIAAAGHGGQVLLSQATRDLAEAELPPETQILDLGEYRLKDLQRPEHLYQLLLPNLPGDFPLLKTLDRAHHNLPIQPTPLIGREEAVAVLARLLEEPATRLVTLTGPGGIGKTRLALQVAAEVVDRFADGVYMVALGAIADADLVAATIAQTLGLREAGSTTPEESLKGYLADRRVLLVLDNFEQVVGSAPLLARMQAACAGLALLVTSRVSLHLRGEREYAVSALALPARSVSQTQAPRPDLQTLTQYAAVALFIERAKAVKRDFTVSSANAPAIAEICARLDGLPLAIELAAARVKLVPPQALLARLSSRLKLLTGGPRDLPERQQTLRNTIAWSYDLLPPDEQELFRRLAVFAGGCTLEAAETVCAVPDGMRALTLDVFDGLGSLVDKSLLRQQEEGEEDTGEARFRMLETIREFGLEQLEVSEERTRSEPSGPGPGAGPLHRAHLTHYLALAEQANPGLRGQEIAQWLRRLDAEHDNFRAALGWARMQGEVELGLRLAGALAYFWFLRGYLSEGREWLEGLLTLLEAGEAISAGRAAGAVPEAVRARALYGAGNLALWQGDHHHATVRLEQSAALARTAGDLGVAADALNRLGIAAHMQDQRDLAHARWEESLRLARDLGDPIYIAPPLNNLGEAAYYRGDLERAAAYYEESLAITRRWGDQMGLHVMLGNLGNVARRQGDLSRAEVLIRESLELAQSQDNPRSIAEGLEGIAALYGVAAQGARAARLLGAAAALREAIGAPQPPAEHHETEASVARVRAVLGEEAWAADFAAGRQLSPHQAIQEALSQRLENQRPTRNRARSRARQHLA